MTAEIIQFGKPQPAGRKTAASTIVEQRVLQARRARPKPHELEAVRVEVEGRLYEVVFRGKSVDKVSAVHYCLDSRKGRIKTIRYGHWASYGHWNRHELNPAVVEAARRVRGQDGTESNREMAIAQLRQRYARLMREAEKVQATIAIMQRGSN